MKGALLVSAIAFILILAGCSHQTPVAERTTEDSDNCANEGETIGATEMPSECCPGLEAMTGHPGGYDGDCSIMAPPTGLSICSNCGNGECNSKTGENKCNCPADCKVE